MSRRSLLASWASFTWVGVVGVVGGAASACDLFPSADSDPYYGGNYYPPFAPPDAGSSQPLADFGTATRAPNARSIVGGTLLVSRDGTLALASDHERDLVVLVDLVEEKRRSRLALDAGDEPSRAVESDDGNFHVVLRAGAILTIDRVTGEVIARRATCAEPRGIAADDVGRRLFVACEGGELMTMPYDTTMEGARLAKLDRDLRDVVLVRDRLYISRFRAAEVLVVGMDGTPIERRLPMGLYPNRDNSLSPSAAFAPGASSPMVGFRMVAAPPGNADDGSDEGPILVHEEGRDSLLPSSTTGYYGSPPVPFDPCGGDSVVLPAITALGPRPQTVRLPTQAVLPVDVAWVDGWVGVVAAGNGHTRSLPQLYVVPMDRLRARAVAAPDPCAPQNIREVRVSGQVVSVAPWRGGTPSFLVQTREPAMLHRYTTAGELVSTIALADSSVEDTGHAIFHSNSGVGIACASCHPEGGDDGKVWNLEREYLRTPSLRGTLKGTAPYHWRGDLANIHAMADATFGVRMNGQQLSWVQKDLLEDWLFALRAPKASPTSDMEQLARGKALFEARQCTACHVAEGKAPTRTLYDQTGRLVQTPSLRGVAARAPYFHDGCAPTLTAAISSTCEIQEHSLSDLSPEARADLVTYLESL